MRSFKHRIAGELHEKWRSPQVTIRQKHIFARSSEVANVARHIAALATFTSARLTMLSLPWYSLPLAGGLLLNISTSSFLTLTGRVLGVSGIIDGAAFDGTGWKVASALGLLVAPVVNNLIGLYEVAPTTVPVVAPTAMIVAAGFLVGLGSRVSRNAHRVFVPR